jgi:nucleotide-binding universal stress UspA family protein
MEIRRILVPYDFSEYSQRAFGCAVHLARQWQCSIDLLHVVPLLTSTSPLLTSGAINLTNIRENLQADAEESLSQRVADAGTQSVDVRPRVLIGEPFDEICRVAEASHSDLIVMGSHGRTGFAHVFLGSVAERVVRHAPCPVLVIRREATTGQPAAAENASANPERLP